MLAIVIFFISLLHSIQNRSVICLFGFHLIVLTAISIYVVNGIDVVYKIDPSHPSDSFMYYGGYTSPWNQIGTYGFSEYPYFLRVLSFPIVNALFATWGQSALLFLLLDLIVRNKRNLWLFITLHALIYTCTNLFKDNLILLIGLGGYLVLNKVRNVWLQCMVILGMIAMMAWVRPFLSLTMPLCLFPLLFRIKSVRTKNLLLALCFLGGTVYLYMQRDFIAGVMNAFANDTSIIEGKSSPPVAVVKILLGPTPVHYLFARDFFVQPFLPAQSVFFCLLHGLYYISFAFLIAYVIFRYKTICNLYKASTAKLSLLLFALAQMLVYVVIYGSADIRQRAVILTFLFIFCLTDEPIFKRHLSRNRYIVFGTFLTALLLLTFIG